MELSTPESKNAFTPISPNSSRAARLFAYATLSITGSIFTLNVNAASYLNGPPEDWRFTLMSEAYNLSLDGSLSNSSRSDENINSAFLATADTLNIDQSLTPAFYANLSKNKTTFGIYYMPIEYTGSGFGAGALLTQSLSGFITVPIDAKLNLDILLGNINYQFIQTSNSVLGLGFGFGQINADLNFESSQGFSYSYQDEQPFGFINVHMANRHKRLYYGFTLNALSVQLDESSEAYTDYKIDIGYQILSQKTQVEILGGWRHVNLQFEVPENASVIQADVEMKGPYLDLSLSW